MEEEDNNDEDDDKVDDMASDILPTPVVRKRRRRSNFQECIICEGVKNEPLRLALDPSIKRFVDALKTRLDRVYDRVFPDVHLLTNESVKWHSSCYENYTSKQNLRYIRKIPLSSEDEKITDESSSKFLRSTSSVIDWSTCLFCKCKTHKKVKKMVKVTTFEACQSIKSSAEIKGDENMLHILRSVNYDLIAAEAVYHKACHASYVSKANLKYQSKQNEDQPKLNMYEEAFRELVNSVESNIMSGKAYDMNTLLNKYKSFLKTKGGQAESYTRQKLKSRLITQFKDDIVFHQPFDRSKPELVYSSSITLKDVINACASADSAGDEHTSFIPEPELHEDLDTTSEKRQLIYKAAKMIRADISDCKGITTRPLDVNDLSLASSKAIIPRSLYWLMRWVTTAEEFKSEREFVEAETCKNTSDERKILMLGQDVVHCASRSRVKLPKHVSLAVAVRHLTGSKQLITLLNRMGHCSSYEDVEVIDTGLANEVLAMSEGNRCVIPSNILPGVFIQAAADNNDINEETLDGKNTTHATTHVIYQRSQQGNIPQRREALADHSSRKRSLDTSRPAREIQEIGVFGKRPQISNKLSGQVKEDWFNPDKTIFVTGCTMDMAWLLLRLQSNVFQDNQQLQPPRQNIPGWSGFYSLVFPSVPSKTTIGYCPMLNAPSGEYSTIYTIMKNTEEMGHRMGQDISVITFDLLIYMKAKEVQWKFQDEFDSTIVRMGGFHIALNYMSLLGKKYSNSGLEDLLIESGVYGASTTTSLISGKSYNRGIRAHKLLMETLFRLMWQEFVKWLSKRNEAGDNSSINQQEMLRILDQCHNAVKDNTRVLERMNSLMKKMDGLMSLFCLFKEEGKSKSYTFAFWLDYISMVFTLLQFVKAERTGNWELHLVSTAAMIPHFFAFDRPNYSRWLPVYLIDMYKIKENFPDVWEEFEQGNFCVSRSNQPFAQVWTDMALEQSVNLDSKMKGGIVGITQQPGALERWFLTSHERAAITTSLKEMCGYEEVERVGTHKEARQTRVNRDEEDVQKLMTCFTSGLMNNPFACDVTANQEEKLPLVNIASGVTLPTNVSNKLVQATSEGQRLMKDFINNRVNQQERSFWAPIPRVKIKTFNNVTKIAKMKTPNEKVVTISADRALFGRMVVVARNRQIDLKNVLSYELSTVPIALAHTDGTLRKTMKSALLLLLEESISQNVRPSLPASVLSSTLIIDGMALIQMLKNANEATFGNMASKYFDHFVSLFSHNCSNVDRVDIVFDQYRNKSIKSGERKNRGESASLEVKIYSSSTPVPKQWPKYIGNPRNKENLMVFLSETWCALAKERLLQHQQLVLAGGFKDGTKVVSICGGVSQELNCLFSDQEEADTRMLLHAKHASAIHGRIVIQSPDTDVAILCTTHYNDLQCDELWFKTGVKDRLRFIPIHTLAGTLGPLLCKVLPSFHAITGCDSTSAMSGIGKKKAWKVLFNSQEQQQRISALGHSPDLDEDVKKSCEAFVCSLYNAKKKSIDEARYQLFCRTRQQSEGLPPTSDSLAQHLKRANYQCCIWRRALEANQNIPTPEGRGWYHDAESEMITPLLMTKEQAPRQILEFITCNCSKSMCTGNCSCKKNNLACTEACSCMANEQCHNPNNSDVIDSEDDSEVSSEEDSDDASEVSSEENSADGSEENSDDCSEVSSEENSDDGFEVSSDDGIKDSVEDDSEDSSD